MDSGRESEGRRLGVMEGEWGEIGWWQGAKDAGVAR